MEGECYHQLACLPPQLLAMKYELTQPPENSFRFISCNIHHFCTHVDLKIPEPSLNANQNKSDKLNCFETYILQGQKSRKYHDHTLKTSGIIYIKYSLTSSKRKKNCKPGNCIWGISKVTTIITAEIAQHKYYLSLTINRNENKKNHKNKKIKLTPENSLKVSSSETRGHIFGSTRVAFRGVSGLN